MNFRDAGGQILLPSDGARLATVFPLFPTPGSSFIQYLTDRYESGKTANFWQESKQVYFPKFWTINLKEHWLLTLDIIV